MKSRDLFFSISVVMAFFLGWLLLVQYLNKQHPDWDILGKKPATHSSPATMDAAELAPTTASIAVSSSVVSTTQALPANSGVVPIVSAGQALGGAIGSQTKEDPEYAMRLALSPRGAGIESVTLNDFKQVVTSDGRYVFQQPIAGFEDATRALATQNISVNGKLFDLTKVDWSLVDHSSSTAKYQIDIGAIVRVYKTFEVFDRKAGNPGSSGFEVLVRYGFTNLTDAPVQVKTLFNGVNVPPRELDHGPDLNILAGYADKAYLQLHHDMLESYIKDSSTKELVKSDKGNSLLWVGANSVYFNAIIRPVSIDPNNVTPDYLSSVRVEALNLAAPADARHVVTRIATTDLTLAPRDTTELPLRVFFGPRKRDLLNNTYYSAFPLNYDLSLVLTSGFCGFCTFQWLINVLVWMLWAFHLVLRDWGLAIIALVFLVRLLLHPVTKKSQVNMLQMGKMGPEIERLKKKYGDNKDELNKAMMQVYKQQGFTPILGCLPMFLQMPIWIALWSSLQSTFELRHAPFLHFGILKLTWISDLAKPDHLFTWQPVTLLFGWQVGGLNLLPLLLAVVFFLQQKYTPKPPASTPEQAQQQKMMQWMSLLFPIFLYNGPSGLNLYILTSTSLGIIESKIIRKHIKEQDELAKSGKVIVDAGGSGRSKRVSSTVVGEKPPGLMGRMMGALHDAQQKAEDMRKHKQQDKK